MIFNDMEAFFNLPIMLPAQSYHYPCLIRPVIPLILYTTNVTQHHTPHRQHPEGYDLQRYEGIL